MIQEGMKSFGLVVVLLAAACGGEHQHIYPDAMVDGSADAPASNGCDYTEQRDATNDDVSAMPGTAEATGLTVGSSTTICGAFEATHFDGDITVDIDGFTVAVASDTDVLVRISGDAAGIELVGVDIYGGPNLTTHVGANTFYGDHGVTAVHFAPGTYELIPFALNSQAITATVPYRVSVEADNPGTRCVDLTTGGFTEGSDTAGANDVVAYPTGAPAMLTAVTTDNPEATGITVGDSARVAGSVTDIANQDRYEDRDTFAFATNAATNEATLRLAWTGAANLDFFLYEANNLDPVISAVGTTAGSELALHSLKPSTNYWLVVAAETGSTGLPASYSATFCGASYTAH